MTDRNENRRAARMAFTIAELLVTLALSTLLLVSLLGIVTRLFAHCRILEEQTPARSWNDRLKQQVEFDFQNCRAVLVKSNQLILSGYSQQSANDSMTWHLPAQVVYQPIATGNRSLLVRREFRSDQGTIFLADESLLCADIDQIISLTRLETDVPPGVLSLVWKGSSDGKEFELPMVLVRHGVLE